MPRSPRWRSSRAHPAYLELNPPQPVESHGKIEVLEFFWYGCIHCYNLEPKLDTWLKTLPKDVEFRRVPAVFNERWAHDAAIFYAFEALGLLDKLHRPFFDAIHRDRLRTDKWPAALRLAGEARRRPKKFEATVKSFGVQSKTQARDPADRGLQDRRHAGHGGARPLYRAAPARACSDTVNHLVATVRKTSK